MKQHLRSLRELYRAADWRRFRVKHHTNRYAEILGLAPDGLHMVGYWEGHDDITMFAADEINWTSLTVYI